MSDHALEEKDDKKTVPKAKAKSGTKKSNNPAPALDWDRFNRHVRVSTTRRNQRISTPYGASANGAASEPYMGHASAKPACAGPQVPSDRTQAAGQNPRTQESGFAAEGFEPGGGPHDQ